ncbi:hypothetical protein BH24CHL1_BH24CHL1_16000 [soil metagenome]
MPDAERQTERLNRAIDRLTAHQLVPIFDEPELDELVELAGHLRRELPEGMPDPAFRESLRDQLTDPRPRLVPGAQRRTSRRSPLIVATGAIAAMLVVAVGIGVVSTRTFGASVTTDDDLAGYQMVDQGTLAGAVATATVTVGSMAAVPTREQATATATPSATRTLAVNVPPIDAEHLELGAMSTAEIGRPQQTSDITYSLASDGMADTPSSAPVYRFSVPEVDGMELLAQVANALNLDSEITIRTARGKTIFSLKSNNGTSFVWMPDSGAFACMLSGEATVEGDQDEIVAATYRWLTVSGFPVRDPSVSAAVVKPEGAGLRIDFPVETTPAVALGHPLTVSVLIDENGVIQTVSGYWLQLEETQDLGLLSAAEAWRAVSEGQGYWMSHTPLENSGRFEVETFSVTYVLTVDDRQELVLQPVYRANGTFKDYRGNVIEGVSVVLQAVTPPAQLSPVPPGRENVSDR